MGKIFISIGILLIIIGTSILIFNKFGFAGKLPGDIYINKKNFSVYFPITTCILISIILTLILRYLKR